MDKMCNFNVFLFWEMSEHASFLSVELEKEVIIGNRVEKKCKFPAVPLTVSRNIDSRFLLVTFCYIHSAYRLSLSVLHMLS